MGSVSNKVDILHPPGHPASDPPSQPPQASQTPGPVIPSHALIPGLSVRDSAGPPPALPSCIPLADTGRHHWMSGPPGAGTHERVHHICPQQTIDKGLKNDLKLLFPVLSLPPSPADPVYQHPTQWPAVAPIAKWGPCLPLGRGRKLTWAVGEGLIRTYWT